MLETGSLLSDTTSRTCPTSCRPFGQAESAKLCWFARKAINMACRRTAALLRAERDREGDWRRTKKAATSKPVTHYLTTRYRTWKLFMANDRQVEFARRTINLCELTAKNFSKRADQVDGVRTLIDVGSVLFALSAAFVTLIPSMSDWVGTDGNALITLVAASLLVIRASIERVFFKDPPSRFRDYAFYVVIYPQKLSAELVKDSPNFDLVDAWIELANSNLNDARAKWPSLVHSEGSG